MELIIKNGKAFWSPVSDGVSINNFNKWEQAFRMYANIYTQTNPERAGQLIEYNHVIHSIATTFTWENVYSYDKGFRLHKAKHPQRSWAIILQQAWSMKLRDRVHRSDTPSHYSGNHSGNQHNNWQKNHSGSPCRRFNKGKCNRGKECHYDHRCTYCNKFGHGVIVCRKLIFDKEKGGANHSKKSGGTETD